MFWFSLQLRCSNRWVVVSAAYSLLLISSHRGHTRYHTACQGSHGSGIEMSKKYRDLCLVQCTSSAQSVHEKCLRPLYSLLHLSDMEDSSTLVLLASPQHHERILLCLFTELLAHSVGLGTFSRVVYALRITLTCFSVAIAWIIRNIFFVLFWQVSGCYFLRSL